MNQIVVDLGAYTLMCISLGAFIGLLVGIGITYSEMKKDKE